MCDRISIYVLTADVFSTRPIQISISDSVTLNPQAFKILVNNLLPPNLLIWMPITSFWQFFEILGQTVKKFSDQKYYWEIAKGIFQPEYDFEVFRPGSYLQQHVESFKQHVKMFSYLLSQFLRQTYQHPDQPFACSCCFVPEFEPHCTFWWPAWLPRCQPRLHRKCTVSLSQHCLKNANLVSEISCVLRRFDKFNWHKMKSVRFQFSAFNIFFLKKLSM